MSDEELEQLSAHIVLIRDCLVALLVCGLLLVVIALYFVSRSCGS